MAVDGDKGTRLLAHLGRQLLGRVDLFAFANVDLDGLAGQLHQRMGLGHRSFPFSPSMLRARVRLTVRS